MSATRARVRGADSGRKTTKRRNDPKPRSIDGSARWTKIKGRNPDKKYVMVYAGNTEMGVAYYQDMGYQVVDAGGQESLAVGDVVNKGQELTARGHVLMSVGNERHAEIEQYGSEDNGGQQLADEMEDMILDKRGTDTLRGLGGPRGLSIENDTRPEEVERF